MTKERERLAYKWQKSNNEYMILLTIIIGLFSSQNIIPQYYKVYFYWILSVSILLFGLSIINLNADELIYTWKGLRDNRKSVSKFKRISSIIFYLFTGLIGIIIIILGGYLMLILSGVLPNPIS